MPDIERRIAEWRRTLAQTAGCRPEVLDELEGHLRDEVQRLVLAGEAEDRALDLAVARLGTPQALAAEFAKVGRDVPAAWLPVRVVLGLLLVSGAALVAYVASLWHNGRMGALLAGHVVTVTLGYTATLAVGGLAVCYVAVRTVRELTPGQQRALGGAVALLTWLAAGLTVVGVALGGWWAQDHLGRFWGWDAKETGAALVVAWDVVMLCCCRRRGAAPRTLLLLAFVGNVVVSAAWFGPAVLGSVSAGAAALLLFAAAQLGLFALGLAPAGCLRKQGT